MVCSSVGFPFAIPQDVFLDLPGRCLRELLHEFDPARTLESCKPLAAVRVQAFRSRCGFGFKYDKRLRHFAETIVRAGNNCNFQNGGMSVDHALNLERRNIFSTRYHNIFRTVLYLDVTVRMQYGKIACVEPSAPERMFCGRR